MEGLNLTSKAQVVISCHRCDRSVNVFCNSCQINLCVACVGKHVDESKSLSHDIIHLKNRKLQMVTPYCKLHPSKRCEVYCKQCDTPACAKCLIGPHKWHEAEDILCHLSKLSKCREDSSDLGIPIPSQTHISVHGADVCIEKGGIKASLASLTQDLLSTFMPYSSISSRRELLPKAKVISQLFTEHKPLLNVHCIGNDEAWTNGKTCTVTRVDLRGDLKDTVVTSCRYWPTDIVATRNGDLIFSNSYGRTVNMIKNGKIETLITTPEGWRPNSLCCTKSGGMLVNTSFYKQTNNFVINTVLRYEGQEIMQTIDNDEYGNPIFKEGRYTLFLTENNNEDICVTDLNKQIVIVLDKTGRVRFQYDGTPAMKENFNPRCIVTDSLGHIIVADIGNNCLHILSQDRQFIRCISNCGLDKPYGLSLDKKERLWVGLQTGQIKVIQYLQ